jgi:hypothetical protein
MLSYTGAQIVQASLFSGVDTPFLVLWYMACGLWQDSMHPLLVFYTRWRAVAVAGEAARGAFSVSHGSAIVRPRRR